MACSRSKERDQITKEEEEEGETLTSSPHRGQQQGERKGTAPLLHPPVLLPQGLDPSTHIQDNLLCLAEAC